MAPIHTDADQELMFPLVWQRNLIADGLFTVESDRAVVVKLGEAALESFLAVAVWSRELTGLESTDLIWKTVPQILQLDTNETEHQYVIICLNGVY